MAEVLSDREVAREGVDPKDVVTSTAFRVSPDLLGIPLASHPKRLLAILIDLLLVALIANQVGGVVLGILVAVFFFRMAIKSKKVSAATPTQGALSTAFRGTVGCMGGVVLFVTILVFVYAGPFSSGRSSTPSTPSAFTPGAPGAVVFPGSGAAGAGSGATDRIAELGDNPTRAEIEEYLAREMRDVFSEIWGAGSLEELSPEVREVIEGGVSAETLAGESEAGVPDAEGAADPGMPDTAAEGEGGEGVVDVERAGPASDDPVIRSLEDSIAILEGALTTEAQRRTALQSREREARAALAEARREAEEGPGIRVMLANLAEDLGLGFGWGALYFSVFLVWWRGQTPGKKLLGLRVVRLDRGAITWWNALERYGGYAAGFATGLLGFAQVYWDPNRQATHDKISGTVVIQDGKPPLPGFDAP